MTKQIDLSVHDDKTLVDSFVKAQEAKKAAEALYEAHKTEFAARGLLKDGETVYGNKFFVKTTCSFTTRFVASACEKVMGAAWMEQFKEKDKNPTWRFTPKAITIVTSETADKVAAL